jgi:hypothetical protein
MSVARATADRSRARAELAERAPASSLRLRLIVGSDYGDALRDAAPLAEAADVRVDCQRLHVAMWGASSCPRATLGLMATTLVSGGENAYPAAVERALLEHPSVADVADVGSSACRTHVGSRRRSRSSSRPTGRSRRRPS